MLDICSDDIPWSMRAYMRCTSEKECMQVIGVPSHLSHQRYLKKKTFKNLINKLLRCFYFESSPTVIRKTGFETDVTMATTITTFLLSRRDGRAIFVMRFVK